MREMKVVMKAQDLYKAGCSVAEISRKLMKSSSNVSRWCRKVVGNGVSREITSQEKIRQKWFDFDRVNVGDLSVESCRILLALLYWCEGAKYPSSNRVDFVCSDESLLLTFLLLFRKSFDLDESRLRVKLQIHTDQDFKELTGFWSDKLKIPKSKFTKPTVTEKRGARYRNGYRGTCSIRYSDYSILLRIMGTYNQVAKQIIGGVR
jgi:hypothetical protein